VLAVALGTGLALAAPLDSTPGWARDALARLVAAGLVEGFPDRTFKGDRSISRFEAAALLSRVRLGEAPSREELAVVRRLAESLREELSALGVRVSQSEENAQRLDRRVTELERIKFYGRFETRLVSQGFVNAGRPENSLGTRRAGGVEYINYNEAVGTRAAGGYRPQVQAIIPVVDYRNGRPLTNGTGLTSALILGMRTRLSEEWEAEAEVAAFTSQGDGVVNAFWGVSAPYLVNPWTANVGAGGPLVGVQPANHLPTTRAVLDHLLLKGPSHTRIVLGTFQPLRIDPIVYVGQPNNGIFGPRRFPGFGLQAQSEVDLGGEQALRYEAFGSRSGDGTIYLGESYAVRTFGGCLAYEAPRTHVRLNFARTAEESAVGGPLVIGLTANLNVPYGASNGWFPRQWVNPPGYYLSQRPDSQRRFPQRPGAFMPNTFDTRPIPGWGADADNAVGFTAGGGNYGPQDQTAFGATAHYTWALDQETALKLAGAFAQSHFRPNRNSPFQAVGNAMSADLEATFWKDTLGFNLSYMRTDPNYQPMTWNATVAGLRSVKIGNYVGAFSLFDNGVYRHNREGLRAGVRWSFAEGKGTLGANAGWLSQTRTSLYDVRVPAGAVSPGTPTNDVLGFAPGFIEQVFYGYATPLQYGPNTANSFFPDLRPREDARGWENYYILNASYKWDVGVDVWFAGEHNEYDRPSSLPVAFGGHQNLVRLGADSLGLGVGWQFVPACKLLASFEWVATKGHLDPAGRYGAYARATGSTDFVNIDSQQFIPTVGVEWTVADNTRCDFSLRHYSTVDRVDPRVSAGTQPESVGWTAHPFNWRGWQAMSSFSVKF